MKKQSRRAFTLVEILVVLAIIMVLAAILFPVFNGVRERGYQSNCTSNLKQIYSAVMMYHNDYKRYPASLAFLVSDTAQLANFNPTPAPTAVPTPTPVTNSGGRNYFKGGMDALLCPDDDTQVEYPYSSYGDLSNGIEYGPSARPEPPGRYVWNYWGYDADGWAYVTPPATVSDYALSNRYAPSSTIITHCVFHRLQTANDLAGPTLLYNDDAASRNARDIVLRLDGSAEAVDVSEWKAKGSWQQQK